jgi:signal transduction histidine kinase
MTAWGAWRFDLQRDEMLNFSLSRLALALGLAAVLWLPMPGPTVAVSERPWAVTAMSILTLAVLLDRPWPQGAVMRSGRTWVAPHWPLLSAGLIAAAIALTGGADSPLAPLVLLLSLPADRPDAPGQARARAWQAGVSAAACYVLAALIALRPDPQPLALVWMGERSIGLGLLAAALSSWRFSRLSGGACAQELRTTAASWRAEALALERTRGEMLAHVSHELLAPIAVIHCCAGLLGELAAAGGAVPVRPARPDGGTGAFDRMVGTILRNSARLELCVQDLLELARLEEGRATLNASWHSCADLLQHAVALLAPLVDSKRQRVRVSIPEPDLMVWGDGRRIERVMTNLLANAHKFAGEGATIAVCASRDAGGTRLAVVDDGPGVPPDALARLFDRYYRAPGVPGQGTGLGLAIVQAEVELHGGKVWAEAAAEHGCRFVCVFPDLRVEDAPPARVIEVGE